jgi:hypothetical protein
MSTMASTTQAAMMYQRHATTRSANFRITTVLLAR